MSQGHWGVCMGNNDHLRLSRAPWIKPNLLQLAVVLHVWHVLMQLLGPECHSSSVVMMSLQSEMFYYL
jgi:hypothetical protein